MAQPLETLGQVLYGFSQDRRQRGERLADEDRRRQQALADLADQRAYTEGRVADQRSYSEGREADQRSYALNETRRQQRDQLVRELIAKNVLTLEESADDAAIARAVILAQQKGVLSENAKLIAEGLLDPAQAGDPTAVGAALGAAGAMATEARTRAEQNRKAAQAQLDVKAKRIADVEQSIATLHAKAANLPMYGEPPPDVVEKAVMQIAIRNGDTKGGKVDVKDAMKKYGEQARDELKKAAEQRIGLEFQKMKEEADTLLAERQFLRQEIGDLQRVSGQFSNYVPSEAPVRALSAPPSLTPEAIRAAMSGARGGASAPPPSRTGTPSPGSAAMALLMDTVGQRLSQGDLINIPAPNPTNDPRLGSLSTIMNAAAPASRRMGAGPETGGVSPFIPVPIQSPPVMRLQDPASPFIPVSPQYAPVLRLQGAQGPFAPRFDVQP